MDEVEKNFKNIAYASAFWLYVVEMFWSKIYTHLSSSFLWDWYV